MCLNKWKSYCATAAAVYLTFYGWVERLNKRYAQFFGALNSQIVSHRLDDNIDKNNIECLLLLKEIKFESKENQKCSSSEFFLNCDSLEFFFSDNSSWSIYKNISINSWSF